MVDYESGFESYLDNASEIRYTRFTDKPVVKYLTNNHNCKKSGAIRILKITVELKSGAIAQACGLQLKSGL